MADHLINGEFVAIPLKTLQSKQWRGLKPYSKVLFITMGLKYKRKGGNGRVKWSQRELIKATGIPRSTVCDGMRQLKQRQFISVWSPGGRWQDAAEYEMSSLYMDG